MTARTASKGKGRERRPGMTAVEARRFDHTSMGSAVQIATLIDARKSEGVHVDCACAPYDSVFTFNRWRAQGLHVRRGEKALRLSTYVPIEGRKRGAQAGALSLEDDYADAETGDDGNGRPRLMPRTVYVFCRCQVEASS